MSTRFYCNKCGYIGVQQSGHQKPNAFAGTVCWYDAVPLPLDTPTRTEFEAAALPPLPEWSKRDDFGGIDGMLPSEVRSGLVAYARQHEQAVRQSIATEWAPVLRALQDALDIFNPEPGEKHLAPKWEARAKTAIAAAMGWPTVSEQKKPVGQFIPGFTAEETAEYWRQHAVPEVKS